MVRRLRGVSSAITRCCVDDCARPIDVALLCAEAFDRLGVGSFLGGSLASSFQGEQRSTNDIDFVVDLQPGQAGTLADALGPEFDLDTEALEVAIRRHRSWNAYYQPTLVKIVLFVKGTSAFDESEFSRRRPYVIADELPALYLKSPEGMVLRKLLWFQAGGEVSTTQRRDVVQVLRVNAGSLDSRYLTHRAHELGVESLLSRSLDESAR